PCPLPAAAGRAIPTAPAPATPPGGHAMPPATNRLPVALLVELRPLAEPRPRRDGPQAVADRPGVPAPPRPARPAGPIWGSHRVPGWPGSGADALDGAFVPVAG